MSLRSRCRRALVVAAVVGVVAGLLVGIHPVRARTVPICFPVLDEPVQYYGTFGDPRGTNRTHEGEDIMGRKMFRLVAPVDGVILNGTDGIRWRGNGYTDHSIRMRGDDGLFYAFLHMNDDTPGTDDGMAPYGQVFGPGIKSGVRVHTGQLLGYMGDSGNAESSSPHLHFEMRQPDPGDPNRVWSSNAFDPYDSLQAASRCGGSFEDVVAGDFDGDQIGDLFAHASGPDADRVYRGTTGRRLVGHDTRNVHGSYRPLGGDFDGDGYSDVLWYAPGSVKESIWYGTAAPGAFDIAAAPSVSGTYTPLIGDFDGDGHDDITWYGRGTRADYIWSGTGTRGTFESRRTRVDGLYRPTSGDFDGDGFDDIFWHGPDSAPDHVWFGTGARGTFDSRARNVRGTYKPFAGDFDGDGVDDVFWYAPGSANDWVWYGARSRSFTSVWTTVHGNYRPVSTDLDGDGFDDVFWWRSGAAASPVWYGMPGRSEHVDARLSL